MDVKRTIKTDMILKNAVLADGEIVDENGEIVDIIGAISKIYGENVEFKLTLTRSTSEELDIDDINDEE